MNRMKNELGQGACVYHSRQELSSTLHVAERGTTTNDSPALLQDMLRIPGVIAAELHSYHVTLHRSPMFEWEEIDPHVWAILDCFNLGEGGLFTDVPADEPIDLGQGFRLLFQREDASLVRAMLEQDGRVVWQDDTINYQTFTREQHLDRVRLLLSNAGLPAGVKL